jgi:hypothetical protein
MAHQCIPAICRPTSRKAQGKDADEEREERNE